MPSERLELLLCQLLAVFLITPLGLHLPMCRGEEVVNATSKEQVSFSCDSIACNYFVCMVFLPHIRDHIQPESLDQAKRWLIKFYQEFEELFVWCMSGHLIVLALSLATLFGSSDLP